MRISDWSSDVCSSDLSILHRASFTVSAARLDQLPAPTTAEVCFVGRSNSGKSSAINVLANQRRLAFSSKTPGRTRLINLFGIPDPVAPGAFLGRSEDRRVGKEWVVTCGTGGGPYAQK